MQQFSRAGAETAAKKVKLSFKIPYKVNFGQDICMVGSTDDLGNWDPRRGIRMEWSEGDVWRVDIEVPAGPHLELEYKYVIRDPDGGVSLWKPGSNYSFKLTPVDAGARRVLPGGAVVQDAWDGSVRDVRVEVLEGGVARPMTDAEREQDAFRVSLVSALEELSAQIGQAEQLGSDITDPTSPDVLQADRLVAAATRKAVAVAHALNAAQAQSRLTAPADTTSPPRGR